MLAREPDRPGALTPDSRHRQHLAGPPEGVPTAGELLGCPRHRRGPVRPAGPGGRDRRRVGRVELCHALDDWQQTNVVAGHVAHRAGNDVHLADGGEFVHQQQALVLECLVVLRQFLGVEVDQLTEEQIDALVDIYGPIQIHQINKMIGSAKELENEIKYSDVVAVVAPVELQAEFLQVANGIPVISCRNKRTIVKTEDGKEEKEKYVFGGWYEIEKIDIVTRDL